MLNPDLPPAPKALAPRSVESLDAAHESAIRAHLTQVLTSHSFESSKRCCDLLTHLVSKTLAGETVHLKERSLGEDVFGRAGYEPSEQNLVRVTANELRKRLALYYEANPSGLRIELPRGSYVPVFHFESQPSAGQPSTPPRASARQWMWLVALAATVAVAALAGWIWVPHSSPESAFWSPVLSAQKPALIWATGWGAVMTADTRDELLKHENDKQPYLIQFRPGDIYPVDQLIGIGHVHGIGSIMSWLGQHKRPAELRLGNWATPSDVHDRPLILFGALNNPWTIEMNRDLRFKVSVVDGQSVVVDNQTPGRSWKIEWRRRGYDQSLDYGVVTRLIDPVSGQVRISIGGICHYASQAAAEFLTTPNYWSNMKQVAPGNWERMNMQVVLEVKVTEKIPESPKPVAWHFW